MGAEHADLVGRAERERADRARELLDVVAAAPDRRLAAEGLHLGGPGGLVQADRLAEPAADVLDVELVRDRIVGDRPPGVVDRHPAVPMIARQVEISCCAEIDSPAWRR